MLKCQDAGGAGGQRFHWAPNQAHIPASSLHLPEPGHAPGTFLFPSWFFGAVCTLPVYVLCMYNSKPHKQMIMDHSFLIYSNILFWINQVNNCLEEWGWIEFGKLPTCQVSKCFFDSKSFTLPPLWKKGPLLPRLMDPLKKGSISTTCLSPRFILINTGKARYSYCRDGETESPSGSRTSYQWLRDTELVSNRSGIQACCPRHPAPAFSPTATQIVSENPHGCSISVSSLLTPTPGKLSLVSRLNSTRWRPPRLDFGGWAIIFIDKAKRKEFFGDSTYILWTFPLQSTSGVDSTGIDSWWLY